MAFKTRRKTSAKARSYKSVNASRRPGSTGRKSGGGNKRGASAATIRLVIEQPNAAASFSPDGTLTGGAPAPRKSQF